MKINDDDLKFNAFLAVSLKFNGKWYSIIWNQFKLYKWIINMSFIKLSSIYYLEAKDSESGLPKTVASGSIISKHPFLSVLYGQFLKQIDDEILCYIYWKKKCLS